MNKAAIFEKLRNHAIGEAIVGIYNQYKFRTEIALYKGKKLSKSEHPSIIHLSFNKAATQYTKSVLQAMSKQAKMVCADYNNYAFYTDKPFLDHLHESEFKKYEYLFQPKGYLYSVFGGAIPYFSGLEDYKIILMVRDPRDMLVSSYFSIKYSHPKPGKDSDKNEEFEKQRDIAQQQDIDSYVLSNTGYYLREFEKYSWLLEKVPNTYITRYEDMLKDRDLWQKGLADFCELPPPDSTTPKTEVKKQENVNSHNRKGEAGDYLEKLKPETILQLNEIFNTHLIQYQYTL